jgi:DNA-binding transcriptional LysR family regulator
MDLRLRQLECFLTLTETLNYGRAAKRLYMTQPTLSFQIKALEEALCIQLFRRNRRSVELTEEGELFVDSAKRILGEVTVFQERIRSLSRKRYLRLCCGPVGECIMLPAILRKLAESDPDFHVELHSLSPSQHLEALQKKQVDVLFMVQPFDRLGISFQQIAMESLIAVLPEGMRDSVSDGISIYDLCKMPILASDQQRSLQSKEFVSGLMDRFGLTPQLVDAPASYLGMFSLVAAGKGVLITSESFFDLSFPGVTMAWFREPLPRVPLGVAWRSDADSVSLRYFLKIAAKVAGQSGNVVFPENSPFLPMPEDRPILLPTGAK